MFYQRKANERGHANFGWLNSKHSFSFGHYYDPKHMGFSVLRVFNDDTLSPAAGFDTHGHANMEIISYVVEGALAHKDTLGNTVTIPAGDIQCMSAGSGIQHSEFNASSTHRTRFLQIWIIPDVRNTSPRYQQKTLSKDCGLELLVSPDGRDQSLQVRQETSMYKVKLQAEQELRLPMSAGSGYLHVVRGEARLATSSQPAITLSAADAVGIKDEGEPLLHAHQCDGDSNDLEALWFDLPS